jgi:ribosomal protein S18 acetylase RimI-like enzyme
VTVAPRRRVENGPTPRPATATDLPAILRGERHYIQTVEPAQLDAWTAAIDRNLDLWIANLSRTTIIESDGEVIGYSAWTLTGGDAVLITIAVLPQHRRHGIGSALLARFIRDGRRAGAAELHAGVLRTNDARALYESAGFRAVTEDDGYTLYAMPGGRHAVPTPSGSGTRCPSVQPPVHHAQNGTS